MANVDDKDKKIGEVPHLTEVTGTEKIPVSADGEARYIETGQLMVDTTNFVTSKQAAQKYYPKVDGDNLANLVDLLDKGLGDKEDRVVIEVVSGETLSALVNRYYRFDSPVNTLAVTLPTIPAEENPRLKSLVLSFTTGDAPSVEISADADVDYFSGYSIDANTSYELNIMFNGSKWVVAYGVVE